MQGNLVDRYRKSVADMENTIKKAEKMSRKPSREFAQQWLNEVK